MKIEDFKKELLKRILPLAKSEEEKQQLIAFINDENNNDSIEIAFLHSHGYYGWITLSSGKTTYIEPTQASPEEVGNALKLFTKKLKEINNQEYVCQTHSLKEQLNELSKSFNKDIEVTYKINDIKRQIKHSKNLLEIRMLNKKLNQKYKDLKNLKMEG